jgi:hypothetical protein
VTKALDPLDWLNARGLKILNITANFGLKDGGKRKNRRESNNQTHYLERVLLCVLNYLLEI